MCRVKVPNQEQLLHCINSIFNTYDNLDIKSTLDNNCCEFNFYIKNNMPQKRNFYFQLSKFANSPLCKCGKFFRGINGSISGTEHPILKSTIYVCETCARKGYLSYEETVSLDFVPQFSLYYDLKQKSNLN